MIYIAESIKLLSLSYYRGPCSQACSHLLTAKQLVLVATSHVFTLQCCLYMPAWFYYGEKQGRRNRRGACPLQYWRQSHLSHPKIIPRRRKIFYFEIFNLHAFILKAQHSVLSPARPLNGDGSGSVSGGRFESACRPTADEFISLDSLELRQSTFTDY